MTSAHTSFNLLFKGFFLIAVLLPASLINAQVFIEHYPPGKGAAPTIFMYGRSTLSDRIPYDHIKGTPFWNEDWRLATLYGDNVKEKWLCKVKLNLASGEVHYLDKAGNELVTDDGLVKKIVFYKNDDTSKADAVFLYNYEPVFFNNEKTNGFMQVLNEGNYQLLKLDMRVVASADSLFGTLKRYYFTDVVKYFINNNQMTKAVKKLDKENVLVNIPGSSAYIDWISQNKINFRKQQDVVQFLEYYNLQSIKQ